MKKLCRKFLSHFIFNKKKRKLFLLKDKFRANVKGINNKIQAFDDDGNCVDCSYVPGLKIRIKGNDNTVLIHQETLTAFRNCEIIIVDANESLIKFGKTRQVDNLIISVGVGNGQSFLLGDGSTVAGMRLFLHEEKAGLHVGNDCMFSTEISVWTTDGHAVIDAENGEILNHLSRPITIGDRCWIGYGNLITKNAQIADGSIVGAGSVVTKPFMEQNVAIAGNPAKIVRRNVTWDRKTAFSLEAHRNKESF